MARSVLMSPTAIAFVWSLALGLREFSLEELAPAPNRAEGIAIDDVDRRAWRQHIATARRRSHPASDLLIPALAVLVACVLSIICACNIGSDIAPANIATRTTLVFVFIVSSLQFMLLLE